jgi:hypothetical protein
VESRQLLLSASSTFVSASSAFVFIKENAECAE